jgi:hypothetical protein
MISRLYIRIVHALTARIVMKQTKIPFSAFGWIRRDRELLAAALVFGMTLAPLETIKSADAPTRPVKDLSQANDQLNWPQDLTPSNGDSFVHNEIWINAPARVRHVNGKQVRRLTIDSKKVSLN